MTMNMPYGQPPESQSFAPNPPPPSTKPKNKLLIPLIAGAGVIALGALGAGAYFLFGRGGPLPVDLQQLPDTTSAVKLQSIRTKVAHRRVEAAAVPEEAMWSSYGGLCEKGDLFSALVSGYVDYDDVEDMEALKTALVCGKKIAEATSGGAMGARIEFKHDKSESNVMLLPIKLENFPESKFWKTSKDPEGFVNTRCHVSQEDLDAAKAGTDKPKEGDGEPKKCSNALAKLAKAPVWAIDGFEVLDHFGKAFSPDGKNKPDELPLFEKLLKSQKGDQFTVGLGKEGTDLPTPDDADVAKELGKALKDLKISATAETIVGGFEKTRHELVASSESDAKDLVRLLEKTFKSAKTKAKEKLDDLKGKSDFDKIEDKDERELAKLSHAHDKAVMRVAIRAYEEAKIEANGTTVVATLEPNPEREDKDAWEAYSKHNAERMKHAAAIVAKVVAGQKPEKEDIKALGAKVVAAFDPPEFIDSGIEGLHAPGRGSCLGAGHFAHCSYKKLSQTDAVSRVKAAAEKDGFKVEQDDKSLKLTKGDKTIKVEVEAEEGKGTKIGYSSF
jgi:hypothetical protein